MRGDIAAAALYVSNWWFIAQNASYFARFGPPSPVRHLWSLAVEEQFYLIWPWLVLAGGVVARRVAATRHTTTRREAGHVAATCTPPEGFAAIPGALDHRQVAAVQWAVSEHDMQQWSAQVGR